MAVLLNYDPFDAWRSLDRLTGSRGAVGTGMPMDVRRLADRFEVALDVPGVDPGSIDVSVDGNTVTVQADRRDPSSDKGEWLVAERPRGRFSRQLTLGNDLDTGGLHASYVDGVLTVTIPVTEKAKPRRIEVEHHRGQTSLESGSTGGSTS